ncbi:olfactory receptor 12D1-like [Leptodactylus fuscus]|uniref:olfactory receptor 12D1-like n=1 Tax=Leptodactylus fuscus TaxID=238119 RepID=UPI003F4EBABD
MELKNETFVRDFVLLGLTDMETLNDMLFVVFLLFYIISFFGNLSVMVIVVKDSSLHSPMYFFLWNLSFLDITYSSVVVPKMLSDFLSVSKTICYAGCIAQIYFFHFLGSAEILLVTAMSYDRYVAIGNPLRYVKIMNLKVCLTLALGSLVVGCFHSLMHTLMTAKLPFCGPNIVNHFFCEIKPLLKLACTDTTINLMLLNKVTGSLATSTTVLTLLSYVFISRFLFRIKSSEGRKRAFSTCSAHLMVVFLLHGTAMFTYLRPSTEDSLDQDRAAAVLFTVLTPALNPIIYTLRNKDMKKAIQKLSNLSTL